MEDQWKRRKILIWGKTRPELSQKYREIVCTGGVFEDTKKLVRLYPIPLRYMQDDKIFKKYQWIEANVKRNLSDPRPESYKIDTDSMLALDVIKTGKNGNWDERANWVMNEENIFSSVEAIQDRQKVDHTSLGLIQPEITSIYCHPINQREKQDFWMRYKSAVQQMQLPLDPETNKEIKPITPADYRFKVKFRCNDPHCEHEHDFSVLDWEVDALYFKQKQRGMSPQAAADTVLKKLREVCGTDRDIHFYVGNISSHPHVFTIVGLWRPKKRSGAKQISLF